MTPDWTPLDRELEEWRTAGKTLPLWWRDDDAVTTGPAIDRLAGLAEKHDFPLHLAVVPQQATQALAGFVQSRQHLIPVVHGWAHQNHAPSGQKKAEFGDHRSLGMSRDDAQRGFARLGDLFANRLCPMFVPPWNRIAPKLASELAGIGYVSLSTFTPRTTPFAAPGLAQINTHLDPIDWKGGRGLLRPDRLIAQLVDQLADRRQGRANNGEPYGILTHHLVHDDAIWAFSDALLARLTEGPVRVWTGWDLTVKGTFK